MRREVDEIALYQSLDLKKIKMYFGLGKRNILR